MRLNKDAKTELIKQVPLFAECSKREVAEVAMLADEIYLPEGDELTQQGSQGRELIVLVEGTAEVRRDGEVVRTLGAGDFVGEIALVTGEARTATVVATSVVRALVVTDRAFRLLLRDSPSIHDKVDRAVQERMDQDASLERPEPG